MTATAVGAAGDDDWISLKLVNEAMLHVDAVSGVATQLRTEQPAVAGQLDALLERFAGSCLDIVMTPIRRLGARSGPTSEQPAA